MNRALVLLLILGLAACGGDDATSPSDLPDLVVLDIVVGDGPVAEVGDSLAVHYVGRLTDGAQFGLGAEIIDSNQKTIARGPVGLREITTYKWVVLGRGQTRP